LKQRLAGRIWKSWWKIRDYAVCDAHSTPGKPVVMAGRNWPGPWRKTPGRVLGISLVRLYQLTLSGFVGNSCRHLPTCSEYAHEAIARHGLWAGGWIGLFRVLRCGPGGTRGIDRVPEALATSQHWFTPWRYWFVGKRRGDPEI
jgi:putative membrane protein insertion efficiency factor